MRYVTSWSWWFRVSAENNCHKMCCYVTVPCPHTSTHSVQTLQQLCTEVLECPPYLTLAHGTVICWSLQKCFRKLLICQRQWAEGSGAYVACCLAKNIFLWRLTEACWVLCCFVNFNNYIVDTFWLAHVHLQILITEIGAFYWNLDSLWYFWIRLVR